ncbi:MAG TPA: protein kinase [Blastocatellia bacterium]|nr:protein kinase [Blastocatellia bacterium]
MTPERWQQVKQIFQSAIELPPSDRDSFISRACAHDNELRSEVESLISSHNQAGDSVEALATQVAAQIVTDDQDGSFVGQSLGPYQVIGSIGKGGMGEVYLAQDTRLARRVALKLLRREFTKDEDRLRRFKQESRAASALNHPNIVTVYEIGQTDSLHYMATEYVEGETLRRHMTDSKIKLREALDIAIQIASALAAAHHEGIIHRDIKPENVMLRSDGYAKVLDFGLAKLSEQQRARDEQAMTVPLVETESGVVMGTTNYMSPEQAEARSVDHRTDIFSLGVVLYEMFTGKQPFSGKSLIDTLHSIVNDEPRPATEVNPQLPRETMEILDKAMAKAPNERYQHAGDFEIDLRRLKRAVETNSLSSLQTKVALTETKSKLWRATSVRAAAGALIILAIAAAWLLGRSAASRTVTASSGGPQPAATASLGNVRLTPLTVDPGFEGEPTFSPDGQTVAYVSDRTGNFDIFLRQVSGGPDINLTNNPADDMQPSFSPDGKQIAFVSSRSGEYDCLCFFIYGTDQPLMGGAIWVMPALGGSPRRIVESGTFPSWSPDGSAIIYSSGPWYGQKVYRVASTGGDAKEIPIEFKGGAPYMAYPSYSPDEHWIVFEANDSVYIVGAQGGEPKPMVKGKHPVWGADGRRIFYTNVEAGKNYSLWQLPFSGAEGSVAGDPSPLTVGRGRDTQATVSRDGKLIAYAALDVSFNLEAVPFDAEAGRPTGPIQSITSGSDLIYFHNALPTDSSEVFESHRGASSFLWKVSRGSPPVQLTSDPNYDDVFPRCSPDGRTIAFDRKQSNDPDAGDSLWLMAQDGANPRLLVKDGGLAGWMHDGKALTYLSFEDGQIYLYDLVAKNAKRITNEEGVYGVGVPSPDGKWIAFMSIASGNVDVRAVPIAGGESQIIVSTPRQDFHPFFSTSGKWLYFSMDHKNIHRVPGPAQGWRKAEPQKVTNFQESGLFLEDAQFTADGRQLTYARRRTTGDIWIMTLNK